MKIGYDETLENMNASHFKHIDKIEFYWDCLGKDALIRMADGTEKRIQDIKIGDFVKSKNSERVKVVNTYHGPEKKIYHIDTVNGCKLIATLTHPFVTKDGIKQVMELTSRDKFLTEKGESVFIKFIYPEEGNFNVYNIALEKEHIMYANGIATGDFDLQNRHHKSLQVEPIDESVKAEVKMLEEYYAEEKLKCLR